MTRIENAGKAHFFQVWGRPVQLHLTKQKLDDDRLRVKNHPNIILALCNSRVK